MERSSAEKQGCVGGRRRRKSRAIFDSRLHQRRSILEATQHSSRRLAARQILRPNWTMESRKCRLLAAQRQTLQILIIAVRISADLLSLGVRLTSITNGHCSARPTRVLYRSTRYIIQGILIIYQKFSTHVRSGGNRTNKQSLWSNKYGWYVWLIFIAFSTRPLRPFPAATLSGALSTSERESAATVARLANARWTNS